MQGQQKALLRDIDLTLHPVLRHIHHKTIFFFHMRKFVPAGSDSAFHDFVSKIEEEGHALKF